MSVSANDTISPGSAGDVPVTMSRPVHAPMGFVSENHLSPNNASLSPPSNTYSGVEVTLSPPSSGDPGFPMQHPLQQFGSQSLMQGRYR